MKDMVPTEGASSEIVVQLSRIAKALESGAGLKASAGPARDSEALRNVQAIGWMFYLQEKQGKVSKTEIARQMGYSDNTCLRRLGTFNVIYDRFKGVERASMKLGSTRRNGRTIEVGDDDQADFE